MQYGVAMQEYNLPCKREVESQPRARRSYRMICVIKAPAAPTSEKAGGVDCDILGTESVNRTGRYQAQRSGP